MTQVGNLTFNIFLDDSGNLRSDFTTFRNSFPGTDPRVPDAMLDKVMQALWSSAWEVQYELEKCSTLQHARAEK